MNMGRLVNQHENRRHHEPNRSPFQTPYDEHCTETLARFRCTREKFRARFLPSRPWYAPSQGPGQGRRTGRNAADIRSTARPLIVLRVPRPRNYGVADGDADGEGDSSAVAAFFFLGEGEADVSAVVAVVDFFLVDVAVVPAVDFFLVVEVDAAVVEVEVASSFFCAQETTKPAATRAMIQDKTDFFIGVVKRSRLFGRRTNRKQLIPA